MPRGIGYTTGKNAIRTTSVKPSARSAARRTARRVAKRSKKNK